MTQNILKIQQIDGGFLVHANKNGKTSKVLKVTVEDVQGFTSEFFKEEPPKEEEKK